MLALLAPAKTLDLRPGGVAPTAPAFLEDAATLSRALASYDIRRLARLLKVRPAKAEEVASDARAFTTGLEGAVPAAHGYGGEVFRAFDGRALSADDLAWAQDRVAILSGLYGLLRPLDGIVAHRLEMSARLTTPRGHNLYAFWGERLTRRINALTEDHADRRVVSLASQEYLKAVWPRSLEGELVDCVFESWKDAARTPNVIPTHSRRARGLMARFVVTHRIASVEGLRAFDLDGYAYQPDRSSARRLVFGRPFDG